MKQPPLKVDPKEFELPETVFVRDIETKVIQMIILQVLSKIEGVGLIEGNLLDTLLGREVEKVKGIFVEQVERDHLVNVKVEIKMDYGVCIPVKAEEVQNKIVEEISLLSGLHVASVHVVVKSLNLPKAPGEQEAKELLLATSCLDLDEEGHELKMAPTKVLR